MLPEALERPCLVGPRNETIEESVGPFGGSSHEKTDRPLWKASDEKSGASAESKDEEDVGPFGESRDDEDVGPLGESRDEDDRLRQDHYKEEGKCGRVEDMKELMQLAAKSVGMISGVPTSTRDASPSHTATTLPGESQEQLTSSSHPSASIPSTTSRKRARDSEDDAKDGESPSQQKRMRMEDRIRMDDILGIVRTNANAAKVSQNVQAVTTPDMQQTRKRRRSLDNDSEDDTAKPTRKRLCLHELIKEISDDKEEYITAGLADVARKDDPTLVYQDTSSNEAQEAAMVGRIPANNKYHKQPSKEDETHLNEENSLDEETSEADDNVAPAEREWDTAHGINSQYANILIPGRGVFDVTGDLRNLYLPTSKGLPDRPWTEEEKEDLRVYIQDYGIQDWALLSQSTNRPETELQDMYFDVITARNIQAGRSERAGILEEYPVLAPPPAPEAPPPEPEEPRKLRSIDQKGKGKKNSLGDLTYDVRATSFPKIRKDGVMVDAKGNVFRGIMGDISRPTKRRQPKLKREDTGDTTSLAPTDDSNNEPSKVKMEDSESETGEGDIIKEEDPDQRAPAPSPFERGPVSKKKGSFTVVKNGRISGSSSRRAVSRKAERQEEVVDTKEERSMEQGRTREQTPSPEPMRKTIGGEEEEEEPEIKQEDSDLEGDLLNASIFQGEEPTIKQEESDLEPELEYDLLYGSMVEEEEEEDPEIKPEDSDLDGGLLNANVLEEEELEVKQEDSDLEDDFLNASMFQGEEPTIKQEESDLEGDLLNASIFQGEEPAIKQEESDLERELEHDLEQQAPTPTAPFDARTTPANNTLLGPKFAGVSKLSGSSRRGVPRKAVGLRSWSVE